MHTRKFREFLERFSVVVGWLEQVPLDTNEHLPVELNSQLVAGAKHSVDSGCELLDEQVRTTDFLRPGSSPVEVVEELPVCPQSPEPARRRETQQQQHCRNKADCLKYC